MKKIYYLNDNKIGHLRQSEGLAKALQQLLGDEVGIESIPAFSLWQYLISFGRCAQKINKNSIVIGAGHRTHFGLIYYRFKYSAKNIVIMKPSLPKSWFRYCIIPRHDNVTEKDNIIITEGAMNALSMQNAEKENQLIILIGGPSDSCTWNNESIYRQLLIKLRSINIRIKIILSTSRRTPVEFISNLPKEISDKVQVIDFKTVDIAWLPAQLLKSHEAWITSESISMVYEALSANCLVQTIDVDSLKGKIAQNINHLTQLGLINSNTMNNKRLNESLRVAEKLLELGLINNGITEK